MLRIINITIWILVFAVTAAAQDEQSEPTVTATVQHSLPLTDIIIDDFSNFSDRFLPYSEARQTDILEARNRLHPFCIDVIEACIPPQYEDADAADDWLAADSYILGYVTETGNAYGYPFDLLSLHGVVNDVLDGVPVLVAYCLHCNSASLFSRQVQGTTLSFSNMSAYYQNVGTLYDIQTGSLWLSVNGQGIVGHYTNTQLTRLSSIVVSWQVWQETHPDTKVLARPEQDTRFNQNFLRDNETRLNLGRFTYPVSEALLRDDRLRFSAPVWVIEHDNGVTAYPLGEIDNAILTDIIDNQEIAFYVYRTDSDRVFGAAYLTQLNGGTELDLHFNADTGLWYDALTDSNIDFNGRFISGSLEGQQLIPVPTAFMYWFAALAVYRDVQLYHTDS